MKGRGRGSMRGGARGGARHPPAAVPPRAPPPSAAASTLSPRMAFVTKLAAAEPPPATPRASPPPSSPLRPPPPPAPAAAPAAEPTPSELRQQIVTLAAALKQLQAEVVELRTRLDHAPSEYVSAAEFAAFRDEARRPPSHLLAARVGGGAARALAELQARLERKHAFLAPLRVPPSQLHLVVGTLHAADAAAAAAPPPLAAAATAALRVEAVGFSPRGVLFAALSASPRSLPLAVEAALLPALRARGVDARACELYVPLFRLPRGSKLPAQRMKACAAPLAPFDLAAFAVDELQLLAEDGAGNLKAEGRLVLSQPTPHVSVPPPELQVAAVSVPPPTLREAVVSVPPPTLREAVVSVPPPTLREAVVSVPPPTLREAVVSVPPPTLREAVVSVPPPTLREAVVSVPPPTLREAVVSVPPPTLREAVVSVPPPALREAAVSVPPPTLREAAVSVPPPTLREAAVSVPPPELRVAAISVLPPRLPVIIQPASATSVVVSVGTSASSPQRQGRGVRLSASRPTRSEPRPAQSRMQLVSRIRVLDESSVRFTIQVL